MSWVGTWLLGVSALHTVAAIHLYGEAYLSFFKDGIFAAVETDAERVALWFMVAGGLFAIIGACLRQTSNQTLAIGTSLFIVGLVGGILLPLSGFWLLIPPALAILGRQIFKARDKFG